ncbi:MAG TPA: lipid-A-disaccharide synthase [Roseiarcus sp.]|nr:lipid-A-disaccharide synthase [Roseiarcus sp.]
MPRILILAGEASGDLHGANLAKSLAQLYPGVELEGLGGAKMQAAGVRLLSGIERLDIIGLPSLSELRRVLAVFKKLSHHIATTSYDAVVLIDNPGLNLRLARVAKRAGRLVIYYIAPQIWAWNERRVDKLRKYVDRLLAILPFEEAYFRKAGVDCVFVGNPIMDQLRPSYDAAKLRAEFGVDPQATAIGLLPGSRKSEIRRLLPVMLEAAQRLEGSREGHGAPRRFILAHASAVPPGLIESFLSRSAVPVTAISDRAYDVIAACDALIVASGTATLQTALVGRPMTIVYRGSALSAALARWVIKVPWIGLANLVAGRQIAKELVQNDVTADRLARETETLLANPTGLALAESVSRDLRAKLGAPGASHRAAAEIVAMVKRAQQS